MNRPRKSKVRIESVGADVLLAGGRAADAGTLGQTYVFDHCTIADRGTVAVALNSDTLSVLTDYTLNWRPVGRSFTVTRAENDRLYEIDGVTIRQLYQRSFGPELAEGVPHTTLEFPLIKTSNKNGSHVCRGILGVFDDESGQLAGNLYDGDSVQLSYGDIGTILDRSADTVRSLEKRGIEGLFVYSCAGRLSFLQDEVTAELAPMSRVAPSAGFFTYGEYFGTSGKNEFMNQTMTLLALSESGIADIDGASRSAEVLEDEANFIEGKHAVLLRALSTMSDAMTAEEKEARLLAEDANQAKSAFLASMSHEIRTPMNAILGFSEILSGSIHDGQQREFLDAIRTSGKSLLGLINDILDLSKVESGKLELQFAPCDTAGVSQEMTQIFGQKGEEKGIGFVVEIDEHFPAGVVIDELRLRQILINLLGNAIKFTEKGQVALRVTSAASGDDAVDLVFDVVDTGIGVPADQIDTIFNAFEQTKGQSAAKFGGTGLGLAISKRLSQMMGGDIILTSDVGKGSTFSVQLGGIAVATEEALAEAKGAVEVPPNVAFEPSKVLIVDDVEYNRLLIRSYLAEYGFRLLEAADGKEGLERIHSERPDIVLTDLRMPEVDGIELTVAVKGDDALKDTPVVAVTASAMKEEEEELKRICDAFLPKPVSKAELVRVMMQFLPHEVTEDETGVAVASNDVWSPDDLTVAERAELPALLSLLDAEKENWLELKETLTINDIELFASRIQEEAHRFGYTPFSAWGERLATQASMFDVSALPATLDEFSRLRDELRLLSAP